MTNTATKKTKQVELNTEEQGENVQTNSVEINGVVCPIDPQALLECESCQ